MYLLKDTLNPFNFVFFVQGYKYTSFDNYPYLFLLYKYALKKYPRLSQRKRLFAKIYLCKFSLDLSPIILPYLVH